MTARQILTGKRTTYLRKRATPRTMKMICLKRRTRSWMALTADQTMSWRIEGELCTCTGNGFKEELDPRSKNYDRKYTPLVLKHGGIAQRVSL